MATYIMYELKDGKFCTQGFTELNVLKKKKTEKCAALLLKGFVIFYTIRRVRANFVASLICSPVNRLQRSSLFSAAKVVNIVTEEILEQPQFNNLVRFKLPQSGQISNCFKILNEVAYSTSFKTFYSKSKRGMDYGQNTEWSQLEKTSEERNNQKRDFQWVFPLLLA